jgi:hypothetical protein
VWDKPNGLPESVTDRVRRSHEDWVHLTLQPRYYSAVDEIREGYSDRVQDRQRYVGTDTTAREYAPGDRKDQGRARGILGFGAAGGNPLGKLPDSVWTIPSEPLIVPEHLGVDHFAAFPTEWPRRIISGWSPAGICTACGEGRRPVSEYVDGRESAWARMKRDGHNGYADGGHGLNHKGHHPSTARGRMVTGFTCSCDSDGYRSTQGLPLPPTRPAVVLDPFGGTGTTALCASVLGRIGITVDLSFDYARLALWRTQDAGQRARAMRVEKPPVQLDGQQDLFGGAA